MNAKVVQKKREVSQSKAKASDLARYWEMVTEEELVNVMAVAGRYGRMKWKGYVTVI